MNFYKKLGKKLFDLSISIIILCILLPLFILLIIALFTSGKRSGIFFYQRRTGKGGKLFTILKFKTMTDERDKNGKLLPDEKRLTALGKFMRSTSLDEIPQLINVIKGDMSLIGPRPLLEKYIPLYSKEQFRRHEVKPGITGWAQVNGRNAISWKEKFKLDVWYVDHLSFGLDLKILWLTILKVFLRKNISAPNFEPFRGDN